LIYFKELLISTLEFMQKFVSQLIKTTDVCRFDQY
jgi:hypothetical protein